MSHAPHQGTRRVLGDDCEECVSRAADLNGLSALDNGNLRELAHLAQQKHEVRAAGRQITRPTELGASYADMKAVETLRLAARIVYRSGITEEVAR